jgi:signal transduction histidine kinase
MLNLKSDTAKFERILIAGPILYFPWYWILSYLLPGTWNSFSLRIAVCVWALSAYVFSKKFPDKSNVTHRLFQALLIFVMFHHFVLAYTNSDRMEYRYLFFVITVLMGSLATSVRSYIFLVGLALLLKGSLALNTSNLQFEIFESSLWFCIFVVIGILVRSNIEAQKELVQLGLKAAESFKMIGLGQMSAGMAHEINNPLAIISGRSQFALRKLNLNRDIPSISKDLEIILKNTVRISKIIRSLNAFSRGSKPEPMQPVSLKQVVEATIETCQEKMRARAIELKWLCVEEHLVLGHLDQLCQVLMALLQNSIDAVSQQPNRWISIETRKSASGIQLIVMDSGQIISPAVADKIMDPFFTTKEVNQGTGLGLSIAKGIVEAHGGTLKLDMRSVNTTFIVQLPDCQAAQNPTKKIA